MMIWALQKTLQMSIWRGLNSFGARDLSPENTSDEGQKSLAPIKTAARQTPILWVSSTY